MLPRSLLPKKMVSRSGKALITRSGLIMSLVDRWTIEQRLETASCSTGGMARRLSFCNSTSIVASSADTMFGAGNLRWRWKSRSLWRHGQGVPLCVENG